MRISSEQLAHVLATLTEDVVQDGAEDAWFPGSPVKPTEVSNPEGSAFRLTLNNGQRFVVIVGEQRLPDVPSGGCPCECNSGGWCGGCGHAGCGGRR